MRIFTKIKQSQLDNSVLRVALELIKSKTENNNKNIQLVFQYLDELFVKNENTKPRKSVGYQMPTKKETK